MRNGKTAVAFVVVLLVSFAVMNAMPTDNLPQACMQEAVLALVALAGVGFAVPGAFKRCTLNVQQRKMVRFVTAALLAIGFVGGVITLSTWDFSGASVVDVPALALTLSGGEVMRNLAMLLGICILTGVYEEAFVRVLGVEALERATDAKCAVFASALLFALLHVGVPSAGTSEVVLLQSALKFVQALLFGIILGVLYAQTRRLWPCALLHAGFDVLYLAPHALLMGTLPTTYSSGTISDTILLAATVILLAATAIIVARESLMSQNLPGCF